MKFRSSILFTILISAFFVGCASFSGKGPGNIEELYECSEIKDPDAIYMVAKNENWETVDIYYVQRGLERRIVSQVATNVETDPIKIEGINLSDNFHLLVDATSVDYLIPKEVMANEGQLVELTVANSLPLSAVSVWNIRCYSNPDTSSSN